MILREDNTDQEDSAFGSQVATAGDVNGDGFDDILIGASGDGVGSSLVSQGRVYVFFGGDRTTLTGHGAWDLTSSGHTGFPIERGFRIEGDANFRASVNLFRVALTSTTMVLMTSSLAWRPTPKMATWTTWAKLF